MGVKIYIQHNCNVRAQNAKQIQQIRIHIFTKKREGNKRLTFRDRQTKETHMGKMLLGYLGRKLWS